MKRNTVPFFILSIAILLVLLLSPINSAIAQDVIPPDQSALRIDCPIYGSVDYPCQNPDGSWSNPGEIASVSARTGDRDVANSGGPDSFGYTWDNSAPFSWIDTSNGTDLGFDTTQYQQKSAPIPLPFVFNYYGFDYSEVYITDSGFISFDDPNYPWPEEPYYIPLKNNPNNVIAPLWIPNDLQGDSWVHYQSGGSAPERYFVVEWHNLYYRYDTASYFTFQVILYEDGNFAFQYQTVHHGGTIWMGFVRGFEDQYGTDGLYTLDGGLPTESKKILVTRPANSARVKLYEDYQGSFTQANTTESFDLLVSNVGDFGNDTFDIVPNSLWDVKFFDANGNPLTDSEGDTLIDTGNLAPGETKLFKVEITSPLIVGPGDTNNAEIQFISSVDPSAIQTAHLQSAIPVPFVQSYFAMDETNHSIGGIDLIQPFESHLTPSWHTQSNSAITDTINGFALAYSSSTHDPVNFFLYYDLAIDLFDQDGNELDSIVLTSNYPNEAIQIDEVAVAGSSDGKIGIVWVENLIDMDGWNTQTNVYFILVDSAGDIVIPKTNLSNNTTWTNDETYLFVNDPNIAITNDNHIMVAWEVWDSDPDRAWDVFYTIKDIDGSVLKDVTQITDSSLGDSFDYPTITSLDDNKFFLAYAPSSGGITYLVFDSSGNTIQSETHFGSDFGSRLVSEQLSDGQVALVWGESYDPEFAIVNGTTFELLYGPTMLDNPASTTGTDKLSVTSDSSRNAVVVWTDGTFTQSSELYYAVFTSDGLIITEPLIAFSGKNIDASGTGYGNAHYPAAAPTTTDADLWVEAPPSTTWAVDSSGPTTSVSTTITFGDQGLSTASNVVLTSTLDSGVIFQSATPTPDQINGNEISWYLPDISSLEHGRLTLSVGLPNSTAGTPYQINWEITSASSEAYPLNNTIITEVKLMINLYIPLLVK